MTEKKIKIAIPAEIQNVPNYLAALTALGAEPLLVQPDCRAEDFDGLLLPGGVDVDPSSYHRENVACGETNVDLDRWQLGVLDKFVQLKKPVFGICRGHQVINVYFGGTLIQHVPHAERHAWGEGTPGDKVHMGKAHEGSYIAKLYGTEFPHNSAHHQAADIVGNGLRVVEYSDDGLVEASFHESLPIWSVQWHPERMCFAHQRNDTVDGSLVISFFLDQVRKWNEK